MSDFLLIGKDLPDSLELAQGFTSTDSKVYAISKSEAEAASFQADNIFTSALNHASAISSRSLIIKAETKLSGLNRYIIVFDAYNYATKFELDRPEDLSPAIDSMISSYQYFINELLFRLEQKKEPAFITFLVKTYPSKYELLINGNKNINIHPVSNIVNTAQNAFIALAENISTLVGERNYLSVLLTKCDPSNELFNNETAIAAWISQSLETLETQKNKQTVKQAATWVKTGGKLPGGFPFFK